MKKNRIIITIIVLCAGLLIATCDKPEKELTNIEFLNDLEQAKSTAAAKGQPLVIEFYEQECPWSKLLDDSTFSHKIVIGMSEHMVFAKIDADEDTISARHFNVSFFPTIVVVNSDGNEVDRLVGYYPPADFFNEIQLYLQGNETLEDYQTRLADEPDNVDFHLIIAEKHKHRSSWDQALEYYGNVLKLGSEDYRFAMETALLGTADTQCEKGDFSAALASYTRFMELYPQSDKAEDVARKIPYCLAKMGDYDRAGELFREYLLDYPGSEYADWVQGKIDNLKKVSLEGN
ncbi:MAG: tetratricopeptide repeat protein [candidate division Zixibacteria bacterium]|nr:tetratricopeptide repeat protein [candidate division Zixibacteria bacterium]